MSSDAPIKPLNTSELAGPLQGFAAYCEGELERRRNAGATFDEAIFRAAMDLAMKKLGALDEEGQL